jgi:hypothetical protein
MKKIYLSLFVSFTLFTAYGQLDSSKHQSKILKKGLYKSYEEFLNNAPSVSEDFSVTTFIKSETDSTIIAANYSLNSNSKKISPVWGFCDGASVYVNCSKPFSISLSSNRYWKLQSLGPYPYLICVHTDIHAVGPGLMKLATALATATSFPQYDFVVLTSKGQFKIPDIRMVRKFLAPYPELLKSFRKESDQYEAYDYANTDESNEIHEAKIKIIKEYLSKLNEYSAR